MTRRVIKVLMIEDNDKFVELMRTVFEQQIMFEYQIVELRTLNQAISLLQDKTVPPFDVILLDLTLPNGAGLVVVQKIKAVAENIPLVVITGMADDQLAIDSLRVFADDYLVKGPLQAREVIERVRNVIVRHEARKEIGDGLRQVEQALARTITECETDKNLPPYPDSPSDKATKVGK